MEPQLWIFGLPKDRPTALSFLKELDCKTVTVGRDREAVKAIVDEGLEAHVTLGTFSIRETNLEGEEFLARRLDGTPIIWFGSGCPNNPKVREASLNVVRDAASIEGVEAVILDGIRFASPGEGIESFMTCFCEECKRKARELGYDMSEIEASLRGLLKSIKNLTPSLLNSLSNWNSPIDLFDLLLRFPGALEWLRFRADCIVEHVADVKKAVKSVNPNCKLGAYLFTPSLAYLVGQDYRRLVNLLDYVEPMIYRAGNGVACLNYEVARMAADIYEKGSNLDQVEVQRFLFNLLGLNAKPETTIEKLRGGISANTVGDETKRAITVVGASKLIPILFLDDPFLKESVQGALKAGVQALSFYKFSEGMESALRTVVEMMKTF